MGKKLKLELTLYTNKTEFVSSGAVENAIKRMLAFDSTRPAPIVSCGGDFFMIENGQAVEYNYELDIYYRE